MRVTVMIACICCNVTRWQIVWAKKVISRSVCPQSRDAIVSIGRTSIELRASSLLLTFWLAQCPPGLAPNVILATLGGQPTNQAGVCPLTHATSYLLCKWAEAAASFLIATFYSTAPVRMNHYAQTLTWFQKTAPWVPAYGRGFPPLNVA